MNLRRPIPLLAAVATVAATLAAAVPATAAERIVRFDPQQTSRTELRDRLLGAGLQPRILRVHDVADVADALAVRDVLAGSADVPDVDPEDDALKWIRHDG